MIDKNKVNWVEQNIVDYMLMNPLLEHGKVDDVARAMCAAGLYKTPANMLRRESVINIILTAQKKKPLQHVVVRREGEAR